MATINRKSRSFTDISLMFNTNPFTRDIYTKVDEEAIKNSIRNLVLTKNYERPFHPEIGSQIHGLMFENFDPIMKLTMEKTLTNTINVFEPRAEVISVDISEEQNETGLNITIEFMIKNIQKPVTFSTILKRVR